MPMTYEPIQVIVMTPGQLLVVYLAWVAVTLLAVGFGLWVFTAGRRPDPAVEDTAGSEVTVELPRRTAHRPRTGTIHAPQYQRAVDDDTVVIEQTGARR